MDTKKTWVIAAASDAHGQSGNITLMLDALPAIDAFCYMGDTYADAVSIREGLRLRQPSAAFHSVAGNCWPGRDEPAELTLRFGDCKLLMTHGHTYRVKLGTELLVQRAADISARIALYGHTHIQQTGPWHNGVMPINPGALRGGRYALITLTDSAPDVKPLSIFD